MWPQENAAISGPVTLLVVTQHHASRTAEAWWAQQDSNPAAKLSLECLSICDGLTPSSLRRRWGCSSWTERRSGAREHADGVTAIGWRDVCRRGAVGVELGRVVIASRQQGAVCQLSRNVPF
jgi:hypothetical protein